MNEVAVGVSVIKALRQRAMTQRRTAMVVRVAHTALIAIGFFAFLHVGRLVNAEETALRDARRSEAMEIGRAIGQLSIVARSLSRATSGAEGVIVQTQVTRAAEDLGDVQAQIRAVLGNIDTSRAALIAGVTARISALIMVLSVLQISTEMHRYLRRMADYLDSRADLLEVATLHESRDGLQDVVRYLADVPHVFGRLPGGVPKEAWEVIQKVVPGGR